MNTHNIELPPLPPLCIAPSVEPVDYPEVAQALMDYARAAIEADRKQRGELHGHFIAGKQSTLYVPGKAAPTFGTINGHDPVVSITPLYTAPQPADPVKVPSDEELLALSRECEQMPGGNTLLTQPAASAEPLLFAINYVLTSFKESEKAGYHTSDRAFAISILEYGLQKYHSAPVAASADPGRDRAAKEAK